MLIKKLISTLSLFSLFFIPGAHAEAEQAGDYAITAGVNYELVVPAQPTKSGDKIEVVEVFWYGCPHCYDFEPALEEWLKDLPDDVEFRRMPGVFRKDWVSHAKAFYAAKKLGIMDQMHMPLFDAIHKEGKRLNDDDSIIKFVSGLDGVDGKAFEKAYNAFSVQSKVKQAMGMSRSYGIRGVPSLVVNGKYYSSASVAGNFNDLLKVVDALIVKERQAANK